MGARAHPERMKEDIVCSGTLVSPQVDGIKTSRNICSLLHGNEEVK